MDTIKSELKAEQMADNTFVLLASFANALAHKIRTPLAVITNEISFLASQGHDCARAQQRSKDIAQILKSATILGSTNVTESKIDITQSIVKVFPSIKPTARINSIGDEMRLETTLKLIKIFVNDLSAAEHAQTNDGCIPVFEHTPSEAMLSMQCMMHDPISVGGEFGSLTELFSQNLHLDLIEPPLIDASAKACGITILAKLVDGKFSITCSWKVT